MHTVWIDVQTCNKPVVGHRDDLNLILLHEKDQLSVPAQLLYAFLIAFKSSFVLCLAAAKRMFEVDVCLHTILLKAT